MWVYRTQRRSTVTEVHTGSDSYKRCSPQQERKVQSIWEWEKTCSPQTMSWSIIWTVFTLYDRDVLTQNIFHFRWKCSRPAEKNANMESGWQNNCETGLGASILSSLNFGNKVKDWAKHFQESELLHCAEKYEEKLPSAAFHADKMISILEPDTIKCWRGRDTYSCAK